MKLLRNRTSQSVLLAGLLALQLGAAHASTFTYHGNLQDAGKPAEGSYDLELTLYSASQGGSAIGGPLTLNKVPVHNGSFSTEADFGPLTRTPGQAWLEVKVRSAGVGEFVSLPARSLVAADSATSVCPGAWTLNGNAGNPVGSYLGTADSQPLVLQMNAQQVAQFVSAAITGAFNIVFTGTNVVLGYSANSISSLTVGATVSGGGSVSGTAYPQLVGNGAHWATISGGLGNAVAGYTATVSGGSTNSASAQGATVSGGAANTASGAYSTVAGGFTNQAGGDYSFAGGNLARVRNANEAGNATGDDGTFVWADDSTGVIFPSSGPHQFLVQSTGGVAINGTPVNPDVELTVVGNGNPSNNYVNLFMRQSASPAGYLISAGQATAGNNNAAFFIDQFDGTNQTRRLSLAANGDFTVSAGAFKPAGGSWSAASDARLKKEVRPLEHPLDRLLQLRGVSFEYLQPDDAMHPAGRHNGFIAQEVQGIFPEWVGTTPDGYLSVGPTGFEALSVEAFRQLREEKDAEIAELHVQLDDLAARMAKLESVRER